MSRSHSEYKEVPFGSSYYEAHITLEVKDRTASEKIGIKHGFHWSQIDGDEVFGKGVKGYLTKSCFNELLLTDELIRCTDELEEAQVLWMRRKIEKIILDEKKV